MKTAAILLTMLLGAVAGGEEYFISSKTRTLDPEEARARYEAYKERRESRYMQALATRRQLNAGKVHVYRTAIYQPVDIFGGGPMIQTGLVRFPTPYRSCAPSCSVRRADLYPYGYSD